VIGGFFVSCRLSQSIAIYQHLLVYLRCLYQQVKVGTNKWDILMKLSDIVVRKAKPRTKTYKMADGGGLFLQLQPNGSKYWRLAYRFEGKQKVLALGVYPDVPLILARERREAARKLLATGIDPNKNRKAKKKTRLDSSENSFEVVAREWLASYMKNKATSHSEKVVRRFERYVFPWIGNKPISDITPPQVLSAVKRIESLGTIETAHRTLNACGQVFRYAVQTGRAMRDVTADLKGALPPTKSKHMATFTDPKEIAELLRAIDGFKGSYTVQCALKIAPMLFVRPGELRMAKWKDIDLDAAEWRYVVSKTKTDHIVPLCKQAIAIFRELHPFSGYGEYVFQGARDPKKPMSEAAINAALSRLGYDTKTQITGHGLPRLLGMVLELWHVQPFMSSLKLTRILLNTS